MENDNLSAGRPVRRLPERVANALDALAKALRGRYVTDDELVNLSEFRAIITIALSADQSFVGSKTGLPSRLDRVRAKFALNMLLRYSRFCQRATAGEASNCAHVAVQFLSALYNRPGHTTRLDMIAGRATWVTVSACRRRRRVR